MRGIGLNVTDINHKLPTNIRIVCSFVHDVESVVNPVREITGVKEFAEHLAPFDVYQASHEFTPTLALCGE